MHRSSMDEMLSDEEIVARVRIGEVALFEQLMRRNNARLYRAAQAILHDEAEAEDVMQCAYVRAYEHLGDFEGRSQLSTWLTRIVVHEALARLRRGRRFEDLESHAEPATTAATPEQEASDHELCDVLEDAIAKLPSDLRAVFVLRAVDGMSGAEVGECLGIPEETVKTRLYRARARLQSMLARDIEPSVSSVYPFRLVRCDRIVAAVLSRLRVLSRR